MGEVDEFVELDLGYDGRHGGSKWRGDESVCADHPGAGGDWILLNGSLGHDARGITSGSPAD
jgi:hypothetical protein